MLHRQSGHMSVGGLALKVSYMSNGLNEVVVVVECISRVFKSV